MSIVTHAELHVLALSNGWGMKRMSALAAALANVITVEFLSGPIPERTSRWRSPPEGTGRARAR